MVENAKEGKKMIQLSNISKKFGETQAVEGISLMIPDGSVFGLLGSNGAGKSRSGRAHV